MKALKYGFGLVLVGGFALTASCGGSSDDSSSSAGGPSGTAGASTSGGGAGPVAGGGAGPVGGGGAPVGGGGAPVGGGGAPVGGGGAPVGGGGAPVGGGGGPAGTAGGAAMNPAGCPAPTTMPKTGDTCMVAATGTAGMGGFARPENCTYPATNPGEQTMCTCAAPIIRRGPGGGAAGAPDMADDTLTCNTACAAFTSTPPVTGDACTGALRCTFGTGAGMTRVVSDNCRCQMDKWTCTPPVAPGGGMGAAGAPG